MKATAIAPSNIAFIKYWGKKDEKLRLPMNSSISMNLSEAYTMTTVAFGPQYQKDQIDFSPTDALTNFSRPRKFGEWEMLSNEKEKMIKHLDRIRKLASVQDRARVMTQNTFPKGSGIASSASGFAALTVAGVAALGLKLSEKELSILARLGSGSACRSIPDGFVEWVADGSSATSYAYSLYSPDYWDLRDIIVIIGQSEKKVSSTMGMEQVKTSPLWQKRVATVPRRIAKVKQALKDKDFQTLGEVIEEDCLDMHAVMQTQNPPLYYWNDSTKRIMDLVGDWRKQGLPVCFTIDAGPNVHLICEAQNEAELFKKIKELKKIEQVIINKPAQGAHLVDTHLF